MSVRVNTEYLDGFIREDEITDLRPYLRTAQKMLLEGKGAGNDYLGWVTLPEDYDREEFARIKAAAKRIQKSCDIFLVLGIGGSYLGARAAIEFVKSPLYNALDKDTPDIYFAGNNLSPTALTELLSICRGKDLCVNVISKSGTTTETAVAFRHGPVFAQGERAHGRVAVHAGGEGLVKGEEITLHGALSSVRSAGRRCF